MQDIAENLNNNHKNTEIKRKNTTIINPLLWLTSRSHILRSCSPCDAELVFLRLVNFRIFRVLADEQWSTEPSPCATIKKKGRKRVTMLNQHMTVVFEQDDKILLLLNDVRKFTLKKS